MKKLIMASMVLPVAAVVVMALGCRGANDWSKRGTDTTKPPLKERMEVPRFDEADVVVDHYALALSYSEEHEQARWVAYMLTRQRAKGQIGRANDFRPDMAIATGSADPWDYRRSGYSRGHLCPAMDMKWDSTAMSETFLMSNMSPQLQTFNEGIWQKIERRVHGWALLYDTLYIVTGPVLTEGLAQIGQNGVSVPPLFYKVVYAPKINQMIGWVVPHEDLKTTAPKLAVTVDSVERLTGIDFFPLLDDDIEEQLEGSYTRDAWDWR